MVVIVSTKDCSTYTGMAGAFCTIATSNIPEIKLGAKVYYLLSANIVTGLLETDVVLDAGSGNRALGHWTVDLSVFTGLCSLTMGLANSLVSRPASMLRPPCYQAIV